MAYIEGQIPRLREFEVNSGNKQDMHPRKSLIKFPSRTKILCAILVGFVSPIPISIAQVPYTSHQIRMRQQQENAKNNNEQPITSNGQDAVVIVKKPACVVTSEEKQNPQQNSDITITRVFRGKLI